MATSRDYGLGEFDFPRGWFAVAESSEVHHAPRNVRFFGQDQVLFRGESGRVVMLVAYCPHMGTHLGKSTKSATVLASSFLEGDSIRCPFHAWRFGADGKCNHIPYYDGPIPEKARVRSWPVEERWGIVFCWNDPEALAPDFPLPEIPEWDDPEFVRWQGYDLVGELQHPVEVFDNMSDAPHLELLHGGAKVLAYENEVDGYLYHQRETLGQGSSAAKETTNVLGGKDASELEHGKLMTTIGAYHGPGLMLARFIEAQGVQLLCTTPTDDGACRVVSSAMMKSYTGKADPRMDEEIRSTFAAALVGGLQTDGEVWAHKQPALQILQLPTDGPFARGRSWYSQFFNPRSKTTEILGGITGPHYCRGIPGWSDSEFAGQGAA